MNNNVLSTALRLCSLVCVLAMVLAFAGCQRAAAPANPPDGAAAAPSPQERIDPAAIEAELIKMERDWTSAAKNKDADTARRVLADDIVITYPDGQTGTKADEVRTIESGAITVDSWELLDPKVTVLNADSAFITGRGIIRNGKYKDPNSKQPIDISGEYRFLDVYARRNGKWQAVASQTTPIRKAQ
ncbi:MAG: nuclear transport factor 2 family protein [Acidobacteria bacterium]|nr:nuclear transport factor 2 family protein [Acidobacteriota bacterium]MCA1627544.1 nuclear transport factor 2 family protein [Acidobacteriota bacterium]